MKEFSSLRWLFALLLLLSLPALACGLTSRDDEVPTEAAPALPDESSGEENVAPVEEEALVAPEPAVEAPAFSDLRTASANLEILDSYRLNMTMSFEGSSEGEPKSGTMHFQSAIVTEPRASQVIVTFEGDLSEEMEGAEAITFTEIGERSYTVFPGFGCITGEADEVDTTTEQFDNLVDAEQMLGEIRDAEYVGEETINGIATFHYRFDESNVEQDSDMEEMDGHVYVAQEGGYVARMLVDGTGALDLFGEEAEASSFHLEYDITDVNTPIVVAPPAECDELGSEYPVMPGASGMASMAGFTSYEVEASLEDVIAFYEEEMPALGYNSDGEQTLIEGFAMLSYNRDGTNVSVTLSEEDGVVSVLITNTEE